MKTVPSPIVIIVAVLISATCSLSAEVRGRVSNQAGRPVQGAVVFTTTSESRDTTDAHGLFHLDLLQSKGRHLGSGDTLVIERKGAVEWKDALASAQDSFSVTLDLVPQEIVDIALSQVGRGPDEVGKDRDSYPFELSRYMPAKAAWCSEFLSWAYLAAGFPLTGGGAGGWMVPTNIRLKNWFAANARFVPKSDPYWDSANPGPGDFVRYHSSNGGHTGIVVRTDGTTLITVEGNLGNRVRIRKVPNWRRRNDVDGIGLRSGYLRKSRGQPESVS